MVINTPSRTTETGFWKFERKGKVQKGCNQCKVPPDFLCAAPHGYYGAKHMVTFQIVVFIPRSDSMDGTNDVPLSRLRVGVIMVVKKVVVCPRGRYHHGWYERCTS